MKFSLGNVVATPGAIELLEQNNLPASSFLSRHISGDWGDLDAEDKQANDEAIQYGNRILSSYALKNGEKLWIITEADRSSTCLLLPREY